MKESPRPFPDEPTVPAAPPDAPGPRKGDLVGEFRVEGRLGEGAMGEVYAAVHPVIKKRVAIKVIARELSQSAAMVERFVQEARVVCEIGHPNIVDVFAFGSLPDGRPYFVMEWLQGETLGAKIARGRLSLHEIVRFLDQICDALGSAHAHGVIHRDLKPDNIFVVRGKTIKILDFGLAKLAGSEDVRTTRTRSGILVGTPLYMSPEQARGRNIDERTDLYALGSIAYEMLCGSPPFEAPSVAEILAKKLREDAPLLLSQWPQANALVRGLLARDPEKRPSLKDVRGVLGELRFRVQSARRPAMTTSRAPNRFIRFAACYFAAIVLFLAAWFVAVVSRHPTEALMVRAVNESRPVHASVVRSFPRVPIRVATPRMIIHRAKRGGEDATIDPFGGAR